MGFNKWWEGDIDQRYWMEIATTGSMGVQLSAPKFQGAAWSYELVGLVGQGDRILHWQSVGDLRGLVGWSVATGEPEIVPEYIWQPRGTSGRAMPGPRTTAGWVVPLGGLNRFERPLTAEGLQGLKDEVLRVNVSLSRAHGTPTYFPFYLYGRRELRAQQGYLVKFPVQLFDVLPTIRAAKDEGQDRNPEGIPERRERPEQRGPTGGPTRIQDPQLRSAIENHAVDQAVEHYRRLGGHDFVKLGKPYDLSLEIGGMRRHVEVKGSSRVIEVVELTVNEVTHARDFQPTDLVVVDGIDWSRSNGQINTTGGRLRIWPDWRPIHRHLKATKFAYSLPADWGEIP